MTADPLFWQTITDSRAAAFLVDAEQSQYFVPFLDRECTTKQLSEEVPCTALQAYRAVELMEQLGLIHVVRKISRRGKPIKVYTSTSKALFVPFKCAPHNSFEDMRPQMKQTGTLVCASCGMKARLTWSRPWAQERTAQRA